jgi:hypothetical protein
VFVLVHSFVPESVSVHAVELTLRTIVLDDDNPTVNKCLNQGHNERSPLDAEAIRHAIEPTERTRLETCLVRHISLARTIKIGGFDGISQLNSLNAHDKPFRQEKQNG